MKFSVGVEYAIHCLLYMVNMEDGKSIGIGIYQRFKEFRKRICQKYTQN